MEMKPRFKLTEVGELPEDWEERRLGQLGKVVRGGSPRPAGDPRYFNGNYIPWLTVASLTNIPDEQLFVTDTTTALTHEGAKHSRTLQRQTLVIVNSGAKTLGISKVLAIQCCANDGIAALVNQAGGDKRFLCYYLNSQIKRLREVVAAGNDQLNLNTARIALLPIPFPKDQEQRAIAETLSEVDTLLGTLDRLITKKRDLKQAAMQQLLTSESRLPGFHGEWNVKRLGELVVKLKKTNRPSAAGRNEGAFPFFTNSTRSCDTFLDEADFNTEAIIANTGGEAYFNYYNGAFAAMADCFVFESRCVTRFLYYVLKFIEQKINNIGFTGSGIKHLDKKYFADVELLLPCNADEQTAIADVLSDIDTELKALEQRREKTRALKQAMMQELLTGRTRLISPKEAHV